MPTVKPGKTKSGSINKKQAAKLSNNKLKKKVVSDVETAYDNSGPKNPKRQSQSKGQKKNKADYRKGTPKKRKKKRRQIPPENKKSGYGTY